MWIIGSKKTRKYSSIPVRIHLSKNWFNYGSVLKKRPKSFGRRNHYGHHERTHFLFETDLPTRYYIPATDVRTDLLKDSATTTQCPYKGLLVITPPRSATTSFKISPGATRNRSRNALRIKDLICFYHENVDTIFIDDVEAEKPISKKSS